MNHKCVIEKYLDGDGEKGRGGNIFFIGDTIYSYGLHFPIARRVDHNRYYFNSNEYSQTTRCHKSAVYRALLKRNATVIELPGCEPENAKGFFEREIECLHDYIYTAKNPRKYIESLGELHGKWKRHKVLLPRKFTKDSAEIERLFTVNTKEKVVIEKAKEAFKNQLEAA